MTAINESARAKLNLFLHVLGKRADGYHALDSLVAFTGLADALQARLSEEFSLTVNGDFARDAGAGNDNLVMKAAKLLREKTRTQKAAAITLTKNIPVGAGLGGGSADAAAALRALNRLWELHLPMTELKALALPLGADVPMCFESAPAFARGIGEELTPVALPSFHALLVHPRIPLLTAEVYRKLIVQEQGEMPSPAALHSYVELIEFLKARQNNLTLPACQIADAVATVLKALNTLQPAADLVRMSGSGACCFALYETAGNAQAAAAALRAKHPGWWINATSVC